MVILVRFSLAVKYQGTLQIQKSGSSSLLTSRFSAVITNRTTKICTGPKRLKLLLLLLATVLLTTNTFLIRAASLKTVLFLTILWLERPLIIILRLSRRNMRSIKFIVLLIWLNGSASIILYVWGMFSDFGFWFPAHRSFYPPATAELAQSNP